MPEIYPQTRKIMRNLSGLGRKVRRQTLYAGILSLVGLGCGALLLGFALDYLVRFPYPLRLLLLICGLGYGGWWFRRRHFPGFRRKLTAERVGLLVEAANPTLQSRLISTLQFQAMGGKIPTSTSADLVAGLCRQTFDMMPGIDCGTIVKRTWIRRQLPVCLLMFMAMLLVIGLVPEYFMAYAGRMVLPGIEYPTRTVILKVGLPERVPAGDPVDLRVTASGVLPELGAVEVHAQDGRSARFDLLPVEDEEGEYACRLEPFTGEVVITVFLGDDRQGPIRVKPILRPSVKSIRFCIRPPAYTVRNHRNQPVIETTGNVRVIEGSDLKLQIIPSKPLRKLKIVLKSGKVALPPMAKTGQDLYSVAFKATSGFAFTLDMLDRDGLAGKDLPTYHVNVIRDRAPVIMINAPRGSADSAPVSRIPLRFAVRDDFCIGRIRIMYRLFKSEDREHEPDSLNRNLPDKTYATISDVGRSRYEFSGFWDNRRIRPLPGQTLRIWVEATDTARPKAHTSVSSEILLRIITAEEYRILLLQKLGEKKDDIDERILELRNSRRHILKLAPKGLR